MLSPTVARGVGVLSVALGLIWPAAGEAQDNTPPGPVEADAYGEVQVLIDDMQAHIDNLDQATTDADEALESLNRQVQEAISILFSRQDENEALRDRTRGLSSELTNLATTSHDLSEELFRISNERDTLASRLEVRIAELSDLLALEQAKIEEQRDEYELLTSQLEIALEERDVAAVRVTALEAARAADQETVTQQSARLASLQTEVESLRLQRQELESQVASLTEGLRLSRDELLRERDIANTLSDRLDEAHAAQIGEQARADDLRERLARSRQEVLDERQRAAELAKSLGERQDELLHLREQSEALLTRLDEKDEEAAFAQQRLAERDSRIGELTDRIKASEVALASERGVSAETSRRAEQLNERLRQLSIQLSKLNAALVTSEERNREQQAQIIDLGRRLNQALATRVQELARYRSEFFGRLREVLGTRPDIQVVGDRFVIQSEVLFETGRAEINEPGRAQLEGLAGTLSEIAETIPTDIDWVLRVDGHTDTRPIRTQQFPSNWELSAARALSVVQFLVESGISPERLVAAGFGQFHPLDPRDDEIAFRRNRRIEFKLTQR
ncbi:MAG: peptidoglycan -binding protein [Alphaproteobacteria bacterium]